MPKSQINFSFRNLAWRVGRKLYCWARKDLEKEYKANGEFWLINQLNGMQESNSLLIFDIGANVGNWSNYAYNYLTKSGLDPCIHAFEPALDSYEFLCKRFQNNNSLRVNQLALSNKNGTQNLYIVGEMAGTNSLNPSIGAFVEAVNCLQLDQYCFQNHLNHINIVKSDAEGHDFKIIEGAANLLQKGQIDLWQFEYNHRWVFFRTFLKDVFNFISDKPYYLGKLTNGRIEIFREWHFELEKFFETNYVLVKRGSNYEKLCIFAKFDAKNTKLYDY